MKYVFGLMLCAGFLAPVFADEVALSSPTAPPASSTAAVTPTSLPGVMPQPPEPGMNHMSGVLSSIDPDTDSFRLEVDGGYNVGFTFNAKTKVTQNGQPISASDLEYGDHLTVGYVGMDLTCWKIERTEKGSETAQAAAP